MAGDATLTLKMIMARSENLKTRSLARTEETLPDRSRFGLSKAQWEAFQKALDAPPLPSRRLARLLKEPSAFERDDV
jgi:uncharacterized protein (DUF1778 family)